MSLEKYESSDPSFSVGESNGEHLYWQRGMQGILNGQPDHTSWEVLRDYRIEDGHLKGHRGVQRIYYPLSEPDVLLDFQRVVPMESVSRQGNSILSFARKWGGLGFWERSPHHPKGNALTVDSLRWIEEQLTEVRMVLAVLLELRDEEGQHLRSDLAEGWLGFKWPPAVQEVMQKRIQEFQRDVPQTISGCLDFANDTVRKNIKDIRLSSTPDYESGKLEQSFSFTALMEVIWWHVFQLAQARILKRCPECSSVFGATRPNQEYCPPSSDSKGVQSQCYLRFRARDRRASRSTPQGGANER